MKTFIIGLLFSLIGLIVFTLPLTMVLIFDIAMGGLSRFLLYIAGLPIFVIGILILRDEAKRNSENTPRY